MREILEEKLSRFEELERQMSNPEVLGNTSQMGTVAREHGSLAKLAGRYRQFKQVVTEMDDAREMMDGDDADMRELAEADLADLKVKREKIWRELLDMTIGGED